VRPRIDSSLVAASLDERDPRFNDAYFRLAAAIRSECPSRQGPDSWLLTSFDQVREVAQDWRRFSSQNIHHARHQGGPMVPIELDPPRHREWRRSLNPHFSPEAVRRHEPGILRIIDDLIDGFAERGSCDAVGEFTRPLPGLVVFGEILGVPRAHVPDAQKAADEALDRGPTPVGVETMLAGFEQIERLSWSLLETRARSPRSRDDLLGAILETEIQGERASMQDMAGAIKLLIFASLTTTQSALTSILLFLADHPELQDQLAAKPERIYMAIDEGLRAFSPIADSPRVATGDAVVGGCPIRPGDTVRLSWAGANRDPAKFDLPDDYNMSRRDKGHAAFGIGPHRCLGSHLARRVLELAFDRFVHRIGRFRLSGPDAAEGYSPGPRTPRRTDLVF
jgi:cytochrome P450